MTTNVSKSILWVVASGALLASSTVGANTFTTPDFDLTAPATQGLKGLVWTGINPDVNNLAQATAYIGSKGPDASFVATVVDYPNGSAGSVLVAGSNFNSVLGSDAGSLSNAAVGTTNVLNSILRFNGFLKIGSDNTIKSLGLGSDDGAQLWIQGTSVIKNDGIHAFPGTGSGPVNVTFAKPGYYGIEILFFESQVQHWGLEFSLGAPGNGSPVPADHLYTVVPIPAALPLFASALAAFGAGAVRSRRRKLPG